MDTVDRLKNLYDKTDQAIFHIVQRFDEMSRDVVKNLDDESKEIFHDRYEALSAYIRHYRLGDKSLGVILESGEDC